MFAACCSCFRLFLFSLMPFFSSHILLCFIFAKLVLCRSSVSFAFYSDVLGCSECVLFVVVCFFTKIHVSLIPYSIHSTEQHSTHTTYPPWSKLKNNRLNDCCGTCHLTVSWLVFHTALLLLLLSLVLLLLLSLFCRAISSAPLCLI